MLIPIISFLFLDISEVFVIYFLFLCAFLSVETCKHAIAGTCFMEVLAWHGHTGCRRCSCNEMLQFLAYNTTNGRLD
jgi:hypothetical protein